jgi:tetratricopeptide (TPR) repeat protein
MRKQHTACAAHSNANGAAPPESPASVQRAALTASAHELLARFQRDDDDAERALARKAYYEQQGDYSSLANLMEDWAQMLHDDTDVADAYVAAAEAALFTPGNRIRARKLYERALTHAPEHELARAGLQALVRELNVPPPPVAARDPANGSLESNAVWLEDEHVQLLEDGAESDSAGARAKRYDDTQRIWRSQC